MNFEMTIKKSGSVYKIRVGRATGNEHIFLFGLNIDFFSSAHLYLRGMLLVSTYIVINFHIYGVSILESGYPCLCEN